MVQDTTGNITRHKDIEDALNHKPQVTDNKPITARVHFHIPLHAEPQKPFSSTIQHTIDTLQYLSDHPDTCTHLEMETYTWGVLPNDLQAPIEDQLTAEHLWVLETATS